MSRRLRRPRLARALAGVLALGGAIGFTVVDGRTSHAEPPSSPSPSSHDAPALDALFAAFAKSPGLFARFREEKQIALLLAPLKSEGTVHFDRTKGLARHTLSPSKRSILLGGGTLSSWDGTKTETLQLASQPALRAFADSFSMFLAADRAGLQRVFRLELSGDPQAKWRLRLTPLTPQLQKIVKELEVAGQGVALSTLRVIEASGDVSTTTFFDVDTAKKYTAPELATLFRVPTVQTTAAH